MEDTGSPTKLEELATRIQAVENNIDNGMNEKQVLWVRGIVFEVADDMMTYAESLTSSEQSDRILDLSRDFVRLANQVEARLPENRIADIKFGIRGVWQQLTRVGE